MAVNPGPKAELDAGLGRAWFPPHRVIAAVWGSYVLTYQAGSRPLPAGASVRVQLPDSWHAWRRNGAKGVQSADPAADNFVTARAPGGHAQVSCVVEGGETEEIVKSNRTGIDGRSGRYVWVVRVTVENGRLEPGDTLEVVFGDRSAGSRGFAAALHPEGPEHVAVAVDAGDGAGERVLDQRRAPVLQVPPAGIAELLAYAPSLLRVGETATVRVVAVDAEGNLVPAADLAPGVSVSDGRADVGPVRPAHTAGVYLADFVPSAEGVLRLEVRPGQADPVLTNPSWVSAAPPARRLYWGDLHSHADHSFDAVGKYPYDYARDVACLDFYALTEHCERWAEGDWEYLTELADKYHSPGQFVTFLAYEATFHEPWGHHNVYFRDPAEAIVLGAGHGTVLDLWAALRGKRALTIPHHTGVEFSAKTAGSIPGSVSPTVDWAYHDPGLRRAVEIYSGHGQSEFYDPRFDLSYELSDFSTNTSRSGPHYARDAWERGHELGVIASSDNHRGQPGRGELGLAAVYSPALERDDVFEALHDRYSYGTTGARILLSFAVGGVPMGQQAPASPQPACEVRVSGTSALESVEIFRGVPGQAGSISRVQAWQPHALDFSATWRDEDAPAASALLYYLRVRQLKPYRGRKPTAWSSPVWITADSAPA